MKNQINSTLNLSEIRIEELLHANHNKGYDDKIPGQSINKNFDEFEDKFDDSDLIFKSEFIKKMKKLEKEPKIEFEDLKNILD